MTDNCSVLRGRKSGFRALMKQQCPKIIDFPGCASHQLNLIQKSEVRAFDTFAQIVKIIELFSSFLNCTPKAQSIMKQCSDFLDVVNDPVYTSVRFLSLYESMLAFLESFPVVTKLISISSDNALKTCFNKENLYEDGSCSTFHQLTELVESCLLVSTHNMIVESGFSLMKTTETSYQSNMTTETYDALRTIQDFWDVEDFEEIEITSELESSVASASERYREVTKEKQVLNSRKRTYAEELRIEVQVFKRKSTLTAQQEITATNNELEQARKLVFDLESRKAMLMKERDAPSTRFL